MGSENIGRKESYFEAAGGRRLFLHSWLPDAPARVLILVHGFGEHGGRYLELAHWFAERAFAVYAYDQAGHGRSPGPRGHVDRFGDLLDDLETLIDLVSRTHPGLERVLLGHSMGGLVVAALVCEREPSVDLLITSGAALTLSPDLSSGKLLLARILSRLLPRLSMNAGLDSEGLSRDPEVVRRYLADPLVHGSMSAAAGAGMMHQIQALKGAAARVSSPALILHGEADPLCLASGSRNFYAGLPHETVAGSALRIYPNLRHEIFNEPEREEIYADVLDWVLRMKAMQ